MSGMPFVRSAPDACEPTEQLLREWALWMQAGMMSRRTINDRVKLVRLLEARTGTPASECGWQVLAGFFAALAAAAPGTRSTYFNHLRRWFGWLVTMEHRLDNPMDRLHAPRVPRRRPRPISGEQLDRVLSSGRCYRRTRTMILLAAYAGLRVHEIAKIRGEDFSDDGWLRVVGKGAVEATLPVHPLIEAERARYPRRGYWFPSPTDRAKPVLDKSVSTLIGQAMRRVGVDATAHQLRHYFGTEVHHAAGGSLRVAQELLRHASPATTALYTRVDDSERRAVVLALT